MSILVIAEHDNSTLKDSTLHTITAAIELEDATDVNKIDVLVVGFKCGSVAEEVANVDKINQVILADNPSYKHFLAENISDLIVNLVDKYQYVLVPATTFGKNILPRVAALLDVTQISDITKIVDKNTFVRPIYAGNALATVQSTAAIKIITVRTTAFAKASFNDNTSSNDKNINIDDNNVCKIETTDFVSDFSLTEFIKLEATKSERPELTSARVVISGGRGLQNKDNFKLIEQLADKLNAAIGASRAAVDAGFVPNDYQVGQTGKIVAPQLYIAIGISGAIQHVAGIKDSKVIVAINKDEDAPIFQVADYGLVGDLFKFLPELIGAF